MKRVLYFLLSAILAAALAGCGQKNGLSVGRQAPAFRLPDLQGHEVSLAQFKGKVVVLDFWASWCGPCRRSMPELEKLQHRYGDRMTLLAINLMETPEEIKSFLSSQKINPNVLLDSEGTVGRIYKSNAIPMQVLIDKEGIVRFVSVGFRPGVLNSEIDKLM
jgi:thiol-disulfide isomerase/thioredoxin